MSRTPESQPRSTRRPKRTNETGKAAAREPLSRERIESEALNLIEAMGMDAFSTRKLGERLGCEAMSIYYHFPSKAHLLDALVDRLLRAVPIPDRNQAPAARLRSLVAHWRVMARAHPRFYLWMALHRWNTPTGVGFLSEILDCFYGAGLSDEAAARGFRALGYYVLGGTLEETSGYAQGPSAQEPIEDQLLVTDFPLVHRAGKYFAASEFDATFEDGLDILLRGMGLEAR